MRERIVGWAERIGHQDLPKRYRDRVVDLLRGDTASSTEKRNRIDDRNLRLLISFCLRSDSNCLEVGAHLGTFLRVIQRVAPAGQHIAYEPQVTQWERLVRLFPDIDIRQRALSDREGERPFLNVLDAGFRGYSRLLDVPGAGAATLPPSLHTASSVVVTERLDGHVPNGWLPSFVKIDVEGAELQVLRGAVGTLKKARPIIVFEHGWQAGVSAELFDLICRELRLRLFDMDGHGPLDWENSTRRAGRGGTGWLTSNPNAAIALWTTGRSPVKMAREVLLVRSEWLG